MKNIMNTTRRVAASTTAKVGTAATGLMASGMALASGSSSPGAAIAGEVAGGKADMGLVIGAIAVLLAIIVVWAYTKRAAK
ncbi:hypothetical protein [Stenotrophomonas sp. HMWF003]|uniref:hypothetical protein n=1 Tax=Stenotrophomonas sp. HMWF003 TaxID=2056840 RepID=UPI000D483FD7|nr:hypothetical protein [Stenotrophomonas sp. HMWF003]PTT59852.1 hypothetical protein DBR34_13905 [Stenotrophomonas sp. HMWF003]